MARPAILVLNAGSSSIKFALFDCPAGYAPPPRVPAAGGEITNIGVAPEMRIDGDTSAHVLPSPTGDPYRAALEPIFAWLDTQRDTLTPVAVAHRVVHGGAKYDRPIVVDRTVLDELRTLIPLAPLHEPHAIDAIRVLQQRMPAIPQVAVFDTTFHRTLPICERILPLPHAWLDRGVRRYGFHGLSYEYLSVALDERFGASAYGRVVAAHLGSGASLCALDGLRSVATTMGFSALDGLMMGTRCGTLDPGVVLYLLEVAGMTHRELGRLLYEDAGLKGVSGRSSDPRELLACEADDPRARDALALYVHRIVRELGALVALLGGLDMLVFTAGIGEHSAPIRERVCRALGWLGIALDDAANRADANVISRADSRVTVVVEPTNEAWIAARSAARLLRVAAFPHAVDDA
jgi:acetate kinase